MSVRPVGFHANGAVDVVHDDPPGGGAPHTGTATPAQVGFLAISGGYDHRYVPLPCPLAGCGSVSVHPVAGGAAPLAVQELFVRLGVRVGCPCGQLPAGSSLLAAIAHYKLWTQRLDGLSRWGVPSSLGPVS